MELYRKYEIKWWYIRSLCRLLLRYYFLFCMYTIPTMTLCITTWVMNKVKQWISSPWRGKICTAKPCPWLIPDPLPYKMGLISEWSNRWFISAQLAYFASRQSIFSSVYPAHLVPGTSKYKHSWHLWRPYIGTRLSNRLLWNTLQIL